MNTQPPSPTSPLCLPARLDAARGYRLTLLVAPAGAGKTALLREWARAQDPPPAWLDLTPAHNDPARFTADLARALGVPLDAGLDLDDTIAGIANALSGCAGDCLIVLDGYDAIDAPQIHAALARLLDYPPRCLHLVLAARAEPPLPIARLRVRRQVLELP